MNDTGAPESQETKRLYPFLIDYPIGVVIRAYPPGLIRLYCAIRSHILRNRILAEIGQYIPFTGDVLELGCGFGLFANCFALSRPEASFLGIDKSSGRISKARLAARRCGVSNVHFVCADAREALAGLPPQDCIYMLDLVHHLPPSMVSPFTEDCWRVLRPGGVMIVKEVSDRPRYKSTFAFILDVLMTHGEIPHYFSPGRLLHEFGRLGAQVTVHRINDYLPYPHILYVCRKAP